MTSSINRSLPSFHHFLCVLLRCLTLMPIAVSNFALSSCRTRSLFDSNRGFR